MHDPRLDVTGAYTPPAAPVERFVSGALLANRYRIVAPLGKGGMGEVVRADDLTLGQPVALKFLPPHLSNDPDRLTAFRKEVAAARKVSHPNVCRVYDIIEHDGHAFLTMEFVDGEDLSSVIMRLGRVPEEKGIDIARQLCSALAAVHEQGLLHRDLKPANVMLDGRGKVRLTDFGLAAAAEDLSATQVRSGTPLYQAPEQLTGKEVTVRSDLYSLGLVLYELLSGKRAYADASRDKPPSRLSSHVSGLSPVVEAVVLRCLEPDPSNRPRSANEVLAGLPGGDPLAAALAAGIVPSPQLVADAGEIGSIRPWLGISLCAGVVVAVVVFAVLFPRVMLFGKIGGLPKSTDWLGGKAREVLHLAGCPDRNAALGYDHDVAMLNWVEKTDQSPERWDRLHEPPAAPVVFWYRESGYPLQPGLFYPYLASIETTRVTWHDPPPTSPEMAGVRLAPDGRLLEFYAVSSEDALAAEHIPDWKVWFGKAYQEIDRFEVVVDHTWVPPVYVDTRYTWVPKDRNDKELPVRIEAGTLRDRVVWFRATPVWLAPSQTGNVSSARAPTKEGSQGIGDQGSAGGISRIYIPLVIALLVLAPITLRSGRGDRRGAFLLGAVMFAILMCVWAVEAPHVLGLGEIRLFILGIASALYWGALIGFSYLVLEPFVRRWWPQAVISWNRLLAGRWRDPLVGRDILIGVLAGFLWVIVSQLVIQVPKWAGEPAPMPLWDWWMPNTRVPGFWVGNFLINLAYSFRSAFFVSLLFLLLLRAIFRQRWAAGVAYVALTSLNQVIDFEYYSPSLTWPLLVLGQLLMFIVLDRFGALTVLTMWFVINTLWFPMTTDSSRDYFVSGLLAMGIILALAGFGFYTSAIRARASSDGGIPR